MEMLTTTMSMMLIFAAVMQAAGAEAQRAPPSMAAKPQHGAGRRPRRRDCLLTPGKAPMRKPRAT